MIVTLTYRTGHPFTFISYMIYSLLPSSGSQILKKRHRSGLIHGHTPQSDRMAYLPEEATFSHCASSSDQAHLNACTNGKVEASHCHRRKPIIDKGSRKADHRPLIAGGFGKHGILQRQTILEVRPQVGVNFRMLSRSENNGHWLPAA